MLHKCVAVGSFLPDSIGSDNAEAKSKYSVIINAQDIMGKNNVATSDYISKM